MPLARSDLSEHFSLLTLKRALLGMQPPQGAFAADAAWRNAYDLYTLPNRPHKAGELIIERRPGSESSELYITYTKTMLRGHRHVVRATIRCRNDALSTPLEWTLQSATLNAQGNEQAALTVRESGRCDGQRVTVQDSAGRERRHEAARWACSWALFDAVQRLPATAGSPWTFTLIDHFGQVKPGHAMRFRKHTRLTVGATEAVRFVPHALERGTVHRPEWRLEGGQEVDFRVFEHTGNGILPVVYWVTESGRLLVVSSGLEGYVLRPADSTTAG